MIEETVESKHFSLCYTVKLEDQANNTSVKKAHKLNKMSETGRLASEIKVVRVRKHFFLRNVRQARKKRSSVKSTLIPVIIANIKQRFSSLKYDPIYPAS